MNLEFKPVSGARDLAQMVDAQGLIVGADVEAHRIAALVEGGMTPDQVLGDYPTLGAAHIDAALAYARAHPNVRQAYPTRTAKSVLRNGGGGGLANAFAAESEGGDDA